MSRIHPECPNPSDRSAAADVLLRQEPDEEEDEEEDEGGGKEDADDDDETDDGYSEWACLRMYLTLILRSSRAWGATTGK
jgi:hypothetical protein